MAGEPRIPPETSLVVAVASLSALGQPLDDEHIYNPSDMIDRYGFAANSPIKSPWLAQVLRDEELGLRGVPAGARVMIFLNDTPERGYVRGRARMIARLSLQSRRVSAVALGAVRGAAPVYELQRSLGAVALAAGDSSSPDLKNLMQPGDRGKIPLAQVAEQLMRSRIDHIRLVTGSRSREVKRAVKHLKLETVINRAWKHGGAVSSFKTGLEALPAHCAAALLVPGRRTPLPPKLVNFLLAAYARCEGDFIALRAYDGSNQPLLIARKYWAELLELPRSYDLCDILNHFRDHITIHHLDFSGNIRAAEAEAPISGLRRPASP